MSLWLPLRAIIQKIQLSLQVNKGLALTTGVNLLVGTIATLILILNVIPSVIPFTPINDIVPQNISSELYVDGYPTFHMTDTFYVTATKCNNLAETVVVRGGSSWVSQDDTHESVNSTVGTANRDPGCVQFKYPHKIAPNIMPGLWRIEGYDQVSIGTRDQVVGWYTNTFMVIP